MWGGGVWEWLDPATAVEAVVRLNREGLRCRLLFLGPRAAESATLSIGGAKTASIALLARGDAFVDANAEWVPYRERLSWLRAGKIAIMLHRPTAEAEFSIRTRLFDAIAAGVPVVATGGDSRQSSWSAKDSASSFRRRTSTRSRSDPPPAHRRRFLHAVRNKSRAHPAAIRVGSRHASAGRCSE